MEDYRKQIMGLTESMAHDRGQITGEKKISDGWFRRLMTRHPQLSLCNGDPMGNVRMAWTACMTKTTIKYFDLLNDTCTVREQSDRVSLWNL